MSFQARQPAGAPTGGQFAATARAEALVTLAAPASALRRSSPERVRARREETIQDFIASFGITDPGAVGWSADAVRTPQRGVYRMQTTIMTRDASGRSLRAYDTAGHPEAASAVNALLQYMDPATDHRYRADFHDV